MLAVATVLPPASNVWPRRRQCRHRLVSLSSTSLLVFCRQFHQFHLDYSSLPYLRGSCGPCVIACVLVGRSNFGVARFRAALFSRRYFAPPWQHFLARDVSRFHDSSSNIEKHSRVECEEFWPREPPVAPSPRHEPPSLAGISSVACLRSEQHAVSPRPVFRPGSLITTPVL